MKWWQTGSMIIIAAWLPCTGKAQLQSYSFEAAEALQKTAQRNTLVFIYTNWCSYCQVMKNTALANTKNIRILNEQFYFVTLNGENKNNIFFNNHLFQYKPNGVNSGTHELAEALGTIDGKLAYPALVILNSKNEILFQYSGLLRSEALHTLLKRYHK